MVRVQLHLQQVGPRPFAHAADRPQALDIPWMCVCVGGGAAAAGHAPSQTS